MKINRHLIELNLGVLFLSTSGVFGRLISLAPEMTIFLRSFLSILFLGTFIKIAGYSTKFHSKSDFKIIVLGGILMGVHWVTYFYSLKLSNIAVAILTLHTFPAMTAILEPLILKTKFKLYHLLLTVLVIIGVWIILPSTDLNNNIVLASIFGLVSALTYALRNIFTRKVMPNYNGSVMMFYQVVIMSVLLSPYLFLRSTEGIETDWPYVILLVIVTTVLGHTLLVHSLKNFSAVTVSLISSVIPVIAILWGVWLLNEIPTTRTMIGGSLILISFLVESYFANRAKSTKS